MSEFDLDPQESASAPLRVPAIPIHPELATAARWLPRHLTNRWTLGPQRAITGLLRAFSRRGPAPVRVSATASLTLFNPRQPAQGLQPAVLWIHGGGYVAGDVQQDRERCAEMAEATGAVVAAVSYRKAPEHPYPAALDDCLAGLRALRALPGIDPSRVAIGGASAGGGLAAALALRVRDEGDPDLAAQLLLYPMLDDRTERPSNERNFRLWEHRSNGFAWAAYLDGADAEEAVPARAASLARVAPAWIGVGTNDLFLGESRDYARGLRAADVACKLVEVPGAWHAFDGFVPRAEVSREFFAAQYAFLRGRLRSEGDG